MEGRASSLLAAMFAAFGLAVQTSAQADTFGSGSNAFTIDFVSIGHAGNAADTTGYGAVPYQYRIGKYEISQDAITKATAGGLVNVTAGAFVGNKPAGNMTWYEAAAFVNWMNTNSGFHAAYNLSFSSGGALSLWSSGDAWTLGGTNLYRHKDAYYFLPSENEWYKAAYFNPAGTNYFLYPTASSATPTAVGSGTNVGTAVFNTVASLPAEVAEAGGLSPYGTMGQGGNVWEWSETAFSGTNGSGADARVLRGGGWYHSVVTMQSTFRADFTPTIGGSFFGFRVASVPEPSTYVLVLLGAGALYAWRRWKCDG